MRTSNQDNVEELRRRLAARKATPDGAGQVIRRKSSNRVFSAIMWTFVVVVLGLTCAGLYVLTNTGPYMKCDLGEITEAWFSNPMQATTLYQGQRVELCEEVYLIDPSGQWLVLMKLDVPEYASDAQRASDAVRDLIEMSVGGGTSSYGDKIETESAPVETEDGASISFGVAACKIRSDSQRRVLMEVSTGDLVTVRGKVTKLEGGGIYLDLDEVELEVRTQ